MKILQIGSYLYPDLVGGAEISAQNIFEILVAAGHSVTRMRSAIGSASLKTRLESPEAGEWKAVSWRPFAPIVQGDKARKALYYAMEFAARVDRRQLEALLREEQVDGVIIHSLRGIGYDMISALADLKVPTIFFLHDLALVCINKSRVRSGQLCVRTCSQCRWLVTKNRNAIKKMPRVGLVGPSRQILKKVTVELNVKGLQGAHVPNPNRYAITPRIRKKVNGRLTIGYVGRLDTEKGVADLLPVLENLRAAHDFRFLIAGKGGLENAILDFAASREWVDFRGFVNPSSTAAVYDEIDIFVMPSLWPENFPGVAVQAITSGSPVVAFEIGGIPEIVENGVSGILVQFGDFSALEKSLDEIMSDPDYLSKLSSGAIEKSNEFNPNALASRLVSFVEKIVEGFADEP